MLGSGFMRSSPISDHRSIRSEPRCAKTIPVTVCEWVHIPPARRGLSLALGTSLQHVQHPQSIELHESSHLDHPHASILCFAALTFGNRLSRVHETIHFIDNFGMYRGRYEHGTGIGVVVVFWDWICICNPVLR